jgi:cytochrome c5
MVTRNSFIGDRHRQQSDNSARFACLIVSALFVAGCSDKQEVRVIPVFEEARLQQGRATWMQVCRNCHLMGVAGAPALDDNEAWLPRLNQGRNTLVANAINGIRREGSWTMPPRGGRDSLGDEDIAKAVDFMLASVRSLDSK